MSRSRLDKRRKSNMSKNKSPSSNKKTRKPLKCKKNISHSSVSTKNSLKKSKSQGKSKSSEIDLRPIVRPSVEHLRSSSRLSLLSQPEKNSISEKNMLKCLDPQFKAIDSVEIDVLSNFTQSNKNISSNSRQSDEFQIAEVINADKNKPKLKSKKHKKKFNKPFVVLADIFQSSNLVTQHCDNSMSYIHLNDINDSKMVTTRTSESSENSLSSQNSMVLRSAQKDERTSDDMFLYDGLESKRNRKSITMPKNQQIENAKENQGFPSKSRKGSVQVNKITDQILRHNTRPQIRIESQCKDNTSSSRGSMTLQTGHSSEKTPMLKNNEIDSVSRYIQKHNRNNKVQKTVELFASSSRNSMTIETRNNSEKLSRDRISFRTRSNSKKVSMDRISFRTRSNSEKVSRDRISFRTRHSSETPFRGRISFHTSHNSEKPTTNRSSLQTRHHYKKTSNNLLSDEISPVGNREQIIKNSVVTKEQRKVNAKTINKCTPLANQETKMLVHEQKRSGSVSKCSLKLKNNKNPHTPKVTPCKSPEMTRSSIRKSLTVASRKNTEKTSKCVMQCSVTLSNAIKETQIKQSKVNLKKLKAEVKSKKNARKRLPSSPTITKTPIQKKRKLSVKFKKQARPKSFSASIPIDSLALTMTPAFARRKTKSDGFSFPGRNTLKRKRFVIEEIKKADDGYEDDIYESKTFDHFKNMFPDSSNSFEMSNSIQTPVIASFLTPAIRCTTPAYEDCFSPTEYALNRKNAEEYIYRNRRKKRKSQVETPDVPEKKKLEFNKVIEKACAVQKEVEKLTEDSSDEEDLYFDDN